MAGKNISGGRNRSPGTDFGLVLGHNLGRAEAWPHVVDVLV